MKGGQNPYTPEEHSLTGFRIAGPVTARGVLDLGPVKTLAGELSSKFKYHKGKTLELKALWSEKANATTLTATAQLLSNLKLRNTCAPAQSTV